MKKIIYTICLSFYILLIPSMSSGYIQYNTHPLINEQALRQSNVDGYLKNQLGLAQGIEQVTSGYRIWQWIRQGGKEEDNNIRGIFHFHDPTKSWDHAGIWGWFFSSLDWAQNNTVGPAPTCSDLTPLDIPCTVPPPGSNSTWSWPAARNYFYQALTSGDPTVRGEKFGNTFLALGHVMHLLADATVPEHTRNDQHLIFPRGSRYEKWAEGETHSTGRLPSFIAQYSKTIWGQILHVDKVARF
jgi:hypothetical protein